MTIEINEGQRFPQQFVNAVVAVGGVALLAAAFWLPYGQLGFPVVLLALLAVQVSVLLFEGEVAVFMAALIAFCCALAEWRGWWAVGFRAASAAVAATLAVWTLRLAAGPLDVLTQSWPAPATLNGACAAVLVLSFCNAGVVAFGGSYRMNLSAWKDGARLFFWQVVGNAAALAAASAAALGVRFAGVEISIAAGALACLVATALRSKLYAGRG